MSVQITRRLKPEEQEVLRKREELAALTATLTERELELVDLRHELAAFEGRYLREVGTLYAELDEWKARILELRARLDPSAATRVMAEEAREQAHQTYEDAHGAASKSADFAPSPELKRLFREAARAVHPDFAKGPADLERRTRLMAEANSAYETGDAESLQRILDEYEDGVGRLEDESIGAELIRLIRQISQAKDRVAAIEEELTVLRTSDIALLKKDVADSAQEGRDLLAELANSVRDQIELTRKEYENLGNRETPV